jgi:methylenetetrahydrofolate dehydrogenase (NADP+)/methenyltetrahydrofolate cyclohydrolase
VKKLDADPTIHGILVQLPLPPHIDEFKILTAMSYVKVTNHNDI